VSTPRARCPLLILFSSFTSPPPTEIYSLSLHDALPIFGRILGLVDAFRRADAHVGIAGILHDAAHVGKVEVDERRNVDQGRDGRSEEHTSELQSRFDLVCRLLLEKKK